MPLTDRGLSWLPAMNARWKPALGVVAVGVLALAAVVLVAVAFGGGKGTATKAEYRATVGNARDRVDFALVGVTRSTSVDELISRLDHASDVVGSAASELGGAKVAKGFGDENDKLVRTLESFSVELANTAATFEDPTFSGTIAQASSLSFPEWDTINEILADLSSQGIRVPPLARH